MVNVMRLDKIMAQPAKVMTIAHILADAALNNTWTSMAIQAAQKFLYQMALTYNRIRNTFARYSLLMYYDML